MDTEPITPGSLERVFLLPGEYHVTRKPKFLATLLGSCVAVCLYNTANGSAAMNHFVRDRATGSDRTTGRFGDLSTAHIIESLLSDDANAAHYEAKLYGGGAVVGHLGLGIGIGERNIDVARQVLDRYNIRVIEEHTGGTRGLKIYFNTATCNIQHKFIGEERKDFTRKNIRVLIVDDSPIVRTILRRIIESTDDMEVAGEAADAYEARDLIVAEDPDVVSLDIIMPKLDGLSFLKKLMEHFPKPIVICSTIAKKESEIEKKARALGAVGVVDKDSLQIYKGLETAKRDYVPMIRTAANRKVEKKIFV